MNLPVEKVKGFAMKESCPKKQRRKIEIVPKNSNHAGTFKSFCKSVAIINDVTLLRTTTVLSDKINWINPAWCLRDVLCKLSPFHMTCFAGSTYFNLFVCPFKQRNMSVMTRVHNFILQFWSSIVFFIKYDNNKPLYFIFYSMLSEIYGIVQERK